MENYYTKELYAIFGEKCLRVNIIHNDTDICINSHEREILYAIRDFMNERYNLCWVYKETMLGKNITMNAGLCNQCQNPSFDGILEEYKKWFMIRIQKIIVRYDAKPFDDEKRCFYEQVKAQYEGMIKEPSVNMEEYKKVRGLFERVRY